MCEAAAVAIKLQCGREYGFSGDPHRATDLSKLSSQELAGLPTATASAKGIFPNLTEKPLFLNAEIASLEQKISEIT